MVKLEQVIELWQNHKVRKGWFPYINFNFENTDLLPNEYDVLPNKNIPDGVLNPDYNENTEEEMRQKYYQTSSRVFGREIIHYDYGSCYGRGIEGLY